jgi:hypothetical protein
LTSWAGPHASHAFSPKCKSANMAILKEDLLLKPTPTLLKGREELGNAAIAVTMSSEMHTIATTIDFVTPIPMNQSIYLCSKTIHFPLIQWGTKRITECHHPSSKLSLPAFAICRRKTSMWTHEACMPATFPNLLNQSTKPDNSQ